MNSKLGSRSFEIVNPFRAATIMRALRRALAGRGAWRVIGQRDGVVEVMARRKAYQSAASMATGTMDWQGLAGEPGS